MAQETPKPVVVRVNAIRSDLGLTDCAAISDAPALAGVRVPKVESAEDVAAVREALRRRPVQLQCLIESARGLEMAFDIAMAHQVAAIGLGEADLRGDLGVAGDEGLLWARSRIVVAARAAGLPAPAMSVYPHLDDLDGLAAHCRQGRELGFLGAAAIHPRQLPVIVSCFAPTEEEATRALELLDELEAAERQGRGGGVLPDGRFVDRAMVEGAKRVLALARRREPRN